MSRFLLVTSDTNFEQRIQSAIAGRIPGSVQTVYNTQLPETPGELLQRVVTELPQVLLLGPGVHPNDALRLASVFDVQHPEISVILVAEANPDLALAAMRAGIRDLLEPQADTDLMRVMLERACHAAESRRRGFVPEEPISSRPSGRVIAVTSPKGGVGKTTIAANLAIGLGRMAPMSTVIVDLDVQFGDVASVLNLVPEHTLSDAVTGAAAQDTMVLKAFLSVHSASIYALCTPLSPAEADRITADQISHMLEQLASEFAFVVIDTAPGLGEHTLAALEAATDVVFLSGMDVPGVRGLRKELDVLSELQMLPGCRHVVVNMADRVSGLSVQDVEATIRTPVDVVVPRSKAVPYSTNKGEPLLQEKSRDKAAKALNGLVARFDPSRTLEPRTAVHRRAVLQ
ncbi:transcriptional regulator [Kocuria dechangensis]|uniref:Transcriptional regulator n=1 Tax=Kocuria dechangensis TaxID=1176249 RepID=A0A917GSK9_9MICC|nr:AAA family ATPase [Kocuria dechangensis]GGG55741.1 transcriptional regulator [Kocuria dechangensis]